MKKINTLKFSLSCLILLIGDFYDIVVVEDKKKGGSISVGIQEFKLLVESNNLIELLLNERKFI